MAERPIYVVDASIAVRWFLRNPPYVEQSLAVGVDFSAQRTSLLAPDNFVYEVASSIRHAAVARILTVDQAEAGIAEFLKWEILTIEATELILPACRLSFRFGCSFYDSLYLAVADFTGHPFIHADAKLHRTLGGRFPLELWIEDHQGL
ncbi:MAG TPA: type II toxin-antitoxin system VapC family toxin [Chloroflexota bacterium]|nr:type II toxin-antitoxin system VapC family toxin [Chloroflexota bacterium]